MEEDKQSNEQNEDRFSRLMFGPRREVNRSMHKQTPGKNQSSHNYDGLLENIGSLIESAHNLKPLIQKVYPYVEKFLKK